MYKDNKLSIKLLSGVGGLADNWRNYLPADSQVLTDFKEPLSIFIKAPKQAGRPPKDMGRAMKIFVDNSQRWQDSQAMIDAFIKIWPNLLRFVAGLSKETVEFLYFSGQATQDGLFSLWPHLPFEFGKKNRFFVSEVSKLERTHHSVPTWFCVEYSHDFFKKLANSKRCQFSYGTTIMGISVNEPAVDKCLQKDFINKTLLEDTLKESYLRCWWLCDPDLEGITIWHKDYSGNDLLEDLQDKIKGKAKKIGLRIE